MDPLIAALSDRSQHVRIGAALAAPGLTPSTAVALLSARTAQLDPHASPVEAAAVAVSLTRAGGNSLHLVASILRDSWDNLTDALRPADDAVWARYLTEKYNNGTVRVGALRLLNRYFYDVRNGRDQLDAGPGVDDRLAERALSDLRFWRDQVTSRGRYTDLAAKAVATFGPAEDALKAGDIDAAARLLVAECLAAPDPWMRYLARHSLQPLGLRASALLLDTLAGGDGPEPGSEVFTYLAQEAGEGALPATVEPRDFTLFMAGEALREFSDIPTAMAVTNLALTGTPEASARAGAVLGAMSADVAFPSLLWSSVNRIAPAERQSAGQLLRTLAASEPVLGHGLANIRGQSVAWDTLRWAADLADRPGDSLSWMQDPAVALPVLGRSIGVIPELEGKIAFQNSDAPTLTRLNEFQAVLPRFVSPPPPAARLPRHPQATFPGQCRLNEAVPLAVRLLPVAADGTAPPFDVPFDEGEADAKLLVTIRSRAFDITPDFAYLRVPREGASDSATFQLTPREAGEQAVDVKFFAGTEQIGHLAVVTKVVEGVATGQATNVVLDPVDADALERHRDASAVLFVAGRDDCLVWRILRPGAPPAELGASPAKVEPALVKEWTETLTQLIQQFLTTDLKPADMQGVLASLTALGSTLLEQIAPPAAIAAIAALPQEALVAIETDADWVPWELLSCDPGGPLWGDRLVLVRVPLVLAPPGPVAEPAAAAGQLNQALLVIGDEIMSGPDALAKRLFGAMAPRAQPALVQTDWPTLSGRAPGADILHFACHGRGTPYHLSYGGGVGRKLYPAQARTLGLRHGTVVFANACSSAAARLMLAEFQSFGRAFYLAGARPFIGTLGPVPEEEANGFASLFYDAFAQQGLSTGQALRSARQQARQRFLVPIWLFYCLYGSASTTRRWR